MSERMELFVVEERDNQKPWFNKVGVAFPSRKGNGYVIQIPPGISISGRVIMMPPKPRDEPRRGDDLDDEVPF